MRPTPEAEGANQYTGAVAPRSAAVITSTRLYNLCLIGTQLQDLCPIEAKVLGTNERDTTKKTPTREIIRAHTLDDTPAREREVTLPSFLRQPKTTSESEPRVITAVLRLYLPSTPDFSETDLHSQLRGTR